MAAWGWTGLASFLLLPAVAVIAVLLLLVLSDRRGPSWAWLASGLLATSLGVVFGERSPGGDTLLLPHNIDRHVLLLMHASVLVTCRALGEGRGRRRALGAAALAIVMGGVVMDARLPPVGDATSREQLAALDSCYRGEPPFTAHIDCRVDIQPLGWRLVIERRKPS